MTLEKTVIMQRVVKVWDEPYEISIHQKSKSVWIAVGKYGEHHIQVQGRSANTAVGLWRDAARYRGN